MIDSIKSLLGLVSDLNKVAEKLEIAELKMRLSELMCQMADLRTEAVEAELAHSELKERFAKLSQPPELEFRGFAYFNSKNEMFCQRCHDADGKQHRLATTENGPSEVFGSWLCRVCESFYSEPS